MGELEETSNLIKKVNRGGYKLSDIKENLFEEIVDILIYIEKAYIEKINKNK